MALSSPKSGTLIGLIHRVQSPGSGRNHGGRDSMSNGHMALGLRSGRNLSRFHTMFTRDTVPNAD